jgi:hypothetical protein
VLIETYVLVRNSLSGLLASHFAEVIEPKSAAAQYDLLTRVGAKMDVIRASTYHGYGVTVS